MLEYSAFPFRFFLSKVFYRPSNVRLQPEHERERSMDSEPVFARAECSDLCTGWQGGDDDDREIRRRISCVHEAHRAILAQVQDLR